MPRPKSDQEYGITCPECGGKKNHVLQKREGRGYVRRRHECLNEQCLKRKVRWNSYQYFSPRRGVVEVPRDTRVREL